MSIRKNGKNSYRFECMINRQRFSKSFKFYTETQTEIKKKFLEWRLECEKGTFQNSNYTFAEFANVWLKNYVEPTCTPHVMKNYKNNLKNWIIPNLGRYKLQAINPLILDNFINYLKSAETKYEKRKNGKLSNSTIEKLYENVRTIITLAYKKGIISSNPCDRVTLELKKEVDSKAHFWDIEDYKKVLDMLSMQKDQKKAFVVEFALKTGLRRSEMFGITWDDVDLVNKTISINKSRQKVGGKMMILPCKTVSSIRTISIPNSIVEKLQIMQNLNETEYVFENVDCDTVTSWYRKLVRKSNLPYIRFHDLRHTHATLLLYKGIDIKTISKRLGHANIGTTMNVYTHVMRELDIKASEAIEAI